MLGGHDFSYVRIVWLVACVFGAAALVALVVIYRWAVRNAELEHAERVIAEHDQSSS
jgi:phage shock protein PspC (stress-responsive transcriptional regulator)